MAYILVGVLAPYSAGFYLSRGNETTCKIQGFMIQLGQTSMFYNLVLSVYFLLVIAFNWKEKQLRRYRLWVHLVVLLIGFGMAIAALPHIAPQFGVCGILPPLTAGQWQVSLFYTAPVSIVLMSLTVSTVWICVHVYCQQKRVQQWMFDQRLKLTRMVLWQSFCYVLAFYVTLPVVLLSFYIQFTTRSHYWLLFTTAALAPLQGMMNAIVYFQRSRGGGLQSSLRSGLSMLLPWRSGVVGGRRVQRGRRQVCTDSHRVSSSRSQEALEANGGAQQEASHPSITHDGNVRADGSSTLVVQSGVAKVEDEEGSIEPVEAHGGDVAELVEERSSGDLEASSEESFVQSAVVEHWRLNEENWSLSS